MFVDFVGSINQIGYGFCICLITGTSTNIFLVRHGAIIEAYYAKADQSVGLSKYTVPATIACSSKTLSNWNIWFSRLLEQH
jgi:hypothetical protein